MKGDFFFYSVFAFFTISPGFFTTLGRTAKTWLENIFFQPNKPALEHAVDEQEVVGEFVQNLGPERIEPDLFVPLVNLICAHRRIMWFTEAEKAKLVELCDSLCIHSTATSNSFTPPEIWVNQFKLGTGAIQALHSAPNIEATDDVWRRPLSQTSSPRDNSVKAKCNHVARYSYARTLSGTTGTSSLLTTWAFWTTGDTACPCMWAHLCTLRKPLLVVDFEWGSHTWASVRLQFLWMISVGATARIRRWTSAAVPDVLSLHSSLKICCGGCGVTHSSLRPSKKESDVNSSD